MSSPEEDTEAKVHRRAGLMWPATLGTGSYQGLYQGCHMLCVPSTDWHCLSLHTMVVPAGQGSGPSNVANRSK